MTYKENTPTFNTGNRKIVNYKDFIQHEPEEETELKKMKRQFKKADQVNAVNQDHQSKYNKVTHKNDDLVKAEVEDKLDALDENVSKSEFVDEFLDRLYMNGTKDEGKYILTLTEATNAAVEIYNQYFKVKS
jgi:hypothetical protein